MHTWKLHSIRSQRCTGYPNSTRNHTKPVFFANSSSCTTTKLSILLTSCHTKIKDHVKSYCDKAYQNSGINLFWSIKNSNEVLNKLQNKGYLASTLSTYDFFSTLYTTLPHDLIKDKLTQLIKKTFQREKISCLACNAELAFFYRWTS